MNYANSSDMKPNDLASHRFPRLGLVQCESMFVIVWPSGSNEGKGRKPGGRSKGVQYLSQEHFSETEHYSTTSRWQSSTSAISPRLFLPRI